MPDYNSYFRVSRESTGSVHPRGALRDHFIGIHVGLRSGTGLEIRFKNGGQGHRSGSYPAFGRTVRTHKTVGKSSLNEAGPKSNRLLC